MRTGIEIVNCIRQTLQVFRDDIDLKTEPAKIQNK